VNSVHDCPYHFNNSRIYYKIGREIGHLKRAILNISTFFLLFSTIFSPIIFTQNVYGLTEIPVGHLPFDVVVNPTISRAYTVDLTDNQVSVIDGTPGSATENTVIATIPIGNNPTGITVDPTTNRVYSANQGSNTVSVIDGTPGSATENTVIATIPVGSGPVAAAVDTITHQVYVGNIFAATVSVIDGMPGSVTENTVIDTIAVGGVAQRVAVDEVLHQVYVTNPFSNTIFVIDSLSNTFTDTITVGVSPVGIVVDPTTHMVYTADKNSNSVTVIDGNTNTVVTTIVVPNGPNGIAFDSNNNRVYVTNVQSNTFTAIDTTTNNVVGTILVGQGPGGVSFDTSTDRIYVANRQSNSVTIIDDITNNPPVAIAGPDQVVNEGVLVSLDGLGLGFGTLTLIWTQTDGPPVPLSDPSIPNPTFTAPQVGSTSVLTFELVVNDGILDSAPDSVNIVVRDITDFQVPLSPTPQGLEGDVDVGDLNAGTRIRLEYLTPPGALPSGELKQTEIATRVDGNDVSFSFIVNSATPSNLVAPPIETALFFDINFNGIDFSNPANFPSGQTPKSRFLIDSNFPSDNRFTDGCPVVPIFLLNEISNQWEQIGDPLKPNTNKIFVANAAEGTVSIIDGSANMIIDTITVPGGVHEVSFDKTTNLLYVSNPLSSSVSVIDLSDNSIIKTIPVGISPVEVDVDTDHNRVYVANRGSNTVSVIDTLTNTVLTTIPVGSTPIQVEIDPGTNRVYVTNFFSNSVSVIDGSTNTVIATIPVGFFASGVGVDPATHRVYSTNFGSNTVSVIDGNPGSPTENTVIDTIGVGTNPATLAVDPNSNKVYVANTVSDDISVIDRSVNVVIDTIPSGDGPILIDINPNTNRVISTNQNSDDLTIIDGSTNTVIANINVGNGPIGLSLNLDVPNPVRDPSTDVIDSGSGDILQCSYLADQPHLSKFAIGGIKALAIGALAGGGGSHGSPSSFGQSSFAIISGGEEGFGGIINDNDVNTLEETKTFKVGEKAVLRFDFTEGGGIGKIEHIGLYANVRDGQKRQDSDAYIYYDPLKSPQLTVHDPNGLFSEANFELLQTDVTKFVLKFELTFAKPMAKSDLILESWNIKKWSTINKIPSAIEVISSGIISEEESEPVETFLEDVTDDQVIPVWVKSNAKWWSDDKIDNDNFISGLEYLVNEGIIKVSLPEGTDNSISEVQPWIKSTAGWWADGMISEDEFITAIEWMITNNIIQVAA